MATFAHKLGRYTVFYSDHALDRWWDRCEQNEIHGRQAAMDLLRHNLDKNATWERMPPAWARLSRWHRARADGFIYLNDESGFVINKNPNGDRVAVTYIERIP